VIIVIDALDECQDQKQVKNLITILFRHTQNLPIKFFITSRPEPRLREAFRISPIILQERFSLHDVEQELVDADIKLYLQHRLDVIMEGRSDQDGDSPDWPTQEELKLLVRRCNKLFIYAATACNFIEAGADAHSRLLQLIDTSLPPSMKALDVLYDSILKAAHIPLSSSEELELVKLVLRVVTTVLRPLSPGSLSDLVGIKRQTLMAAIHNLHSVIYVPQVDDGLVSVLHASFADYLLDSKRSREHYLDPIYSHGSLALQCLSYIRFSRLKAYQTPERIFLPDSSRGPASDDVLTQDTALAYSCSSWAFHAMNSGRITVNLRKALQRFFNSDALWWIQISVQFQVQADSDAIHSAALHSLDALEIWAKVR